MEPNVKKPRKHTVKVGTFKKWSFPEDDFEYEVDEEGYITKLKCKVCYNYLSQIKEEARRRLLRGK